MLSKNELRVIQKQKRNLINIDVLSELILKNLFVLPEFLNAKNIFTYISFDREVNTNRILSLKNKNIFVPKMKENFIYMTKYTQNCMSRNKFGILEPDNSDIVLPEKDDLMIIPALTADNNFYRLGYGLGCYDKYLKNTNCIKIVLLPKILLVANLPVEPHDVCCDIIITESEVLRRKNYT